MFQLFKNDLTIVVLVLKKLLGVTFLHTLQSDFPIVLY